MIANISKLAATALLSSLWIAGATGGPAPPFQSTERNDPQSALCQKFLGVIGLPTYKKKMPGRMFACHDNYMLSYNTASKTPDWVLEHLTRAQVTGPNDRPRIGFSTDDFLPRQFQPIGDDYSHMPSDFQIGHMAPSEDFNIDVAAMKDTFQFSNAVPQVGHKFNAAIWARLEREVRSAAAERGEVFVLTGPVRARGESRTIVLRQNQNMCSIESRLDGPSETHVCKVGNESTPRRGCPAGIEVPIALFKIIYDPVKGTAYGFLMANKEQPTNLGDERIGLEDGER